MFVKREGTKVPQKDSLHELSHATKPSLIEDGKGFKGPFLTREILQVLSLIKSFHREILIASTTIRSFSMFPVANPPQSNKSLES
jgi:hypothetical protein